jgi:hypothetical protein
MYFRAGEWNEATVEFIHQEPQAIPLGAKGKIENYVYEVMGFVVKQETKYRYKWREYLLFSPFRGYAFLSEYNGHWNFMWPIETDPRNHTSQSNFVFQDRDYNLYQKYTAEVVYASGEFFFDVVDITSSTYNYEYIAPPFIFALEKSDDSILWCEGEYFKKNEVAAAFSVPKNSLPSQKGIGYTQPFNASFSDKSLILFTVLVILITLVIQLTMNNSATDKLLFHAEYTKAELTDQKVFVTPSFTLEHGPKNLELYVFAPLSNDWFFSEFTLINETDGTEYNFTKEVQYYSGYEDGSTWTEGSKSGEAILSQIPAGKYHINIYPEFSPNNQAFSVIVRHDVPFTSNFYVTCVGFLLFPLVYFIRKHHREQKRWSESDYSPYATE